MNLNIISIIIRREYLNRVKKKSFLITTFVVPILMAALCIVPIFLMMNAKGKSKKIAVIDRSEIVRPLLQDTETITFTDYSDFEVDSIKKVMSEIGIDAVLSISELNVEEKTFTADLSFVQPLGIEMVSIIKAQVNDALEQYRIQTYNIPELSKILDEVKADVKLNTYTIDEEGKETISETGVFAGISMALGLVLFLFLTLFGSMVMSAVIEEKSSRVVEVLISSVKATELMFGKIIGIALVALTQFILWAVLTFALVSVAGSIVGEDVMAQIQQSPSELVAMPEGLDASEAMPMQPSELAVALGTIQNLPYGKIITVFLLFFLFGYMLYASMFAAVGSAVENEGDSQQLQMPLMIPLMIGYFIAIYTFNAPDSAVAFWGSMIPFTSPVVMLARLPFGVSNMEIVISLVILVATFIACAWASAKIYKVGILMFGKKSTWKDLWRWFKMK